MGSKYYKVGINAIWAMVRIAVAIIRVDYYYNNIPTYKLQ